MEPGPYEAHVVSCSAGPAAIDVDASVTNQSDKSRSYTVYGVVNQPRACPTSSPRSPTSSRARRSR